MGTAGCLWRGTLRALSVMAGRHGEEGGMGKRACGFQAGQPREPCGTAFYLKLPALTKGSRTLSSGSNVHLGI